MIPAMRDMQQVEVNFKLVFEALPGKNILLLPDTPIFTIVAISDAYCKAAGLARNAIVGKGIAALFEMSEGAQDEAVVRRVQMSLEAVMVRKEPATMVLREFKEPVRHDQSGISGRVIKAVHTPVISEEGEVQYIIQHIVITADSFKKTLATLPSSRGPTPGILQQAGMDFRSLIIQSPVAMAILQGKEMILETANARMLELWGKGEGIVGLPIIKALPEIVGQPFPQLLQNVYETGVEYHGFETKVLLKRYGQIEDTYFNFVYAPVKNGDEVTGLMVVAAEVTSLVKAKKALEESEKRYKDLIAKADVATAIYVGDNMIIRLANDAMLRLWGKDSSVIGKPLAEALPELEGQPFVELLRSVYTTGKTYYATEDRASFVVDGHLQSFYFNFTYKALYDTQGRIYGILNMAVDVSAPVKAKIKIKEAEERWRIALDSAELGTWDFFPLTNKLVCSQRTKELFGLLPETTVTFDMLLDAIHIRDRKRVSDEMAKALQHENGVVYRVEYEVTGIEDGKQRWQRTTGQALFNEQGVAYRLTGTVLDITDGKRTEEALEERVQHRTLALMEANRKLERSNQELEQYAYVASHDLQEPLRKIMVYTDLLREGSNGSLPAGRVRLDKIVASAKRMSHLIQDLLNFSRLEKTRNVFSTVDLNAIVGNVLIDFELKIQETGAKVRVHALPVLEASAQQMNQLFYNLISNALKFRKENVAPVIDISARRMEKKEVAHHPELDKSLTYCMVSIRDNGIGFSMKYAKHIFDIFKRLHTRSKFEGTGIGLALCRKITINHKGDIFASSKEGEGSVFHIVLPRQQPAKA